MENNSHQILNMETKSVLTAIDLMYDELLIYDGNYNIVYINQACSRHYCCTPEQMIGKSFFDFIDKNWWEPSILPMVYETKKSYAIKQKTYIGKELLTIAVPIFDESNNIQLVVMNVRDEVQEKDIYKPTYFCAHKQNIEIEQPIYKSKEMAQLMEMLEKIANININVVLSGESGTGKTMLAQYLHAISDRRNYPFVSINCAAIPENLIESELFGYVKGSFTGANNEGKKGLFEIADKGILFLDEVTELSLAAQAKLLHVLQNKEFLPVGSTTSIKVDVRVVAATNKAFKDLVATGAFREDLYYRLNVVEIYIPPLRARRKDILPLIHHFLHEFNQKYAVSRYFTEDALAILINYSWKGNIRELKHIIERLVVTIDSIAISAFTLPKNLFNISDDYDIELPSIITSYKNMLEEFESKLIVKVFEKHNSSRKLANYLSISQTKANNFIKKYVKNNT